MITGSFIELACDSKACAPPPVGTGGSKPSGMRPNVTLPAGSHMTFTGKLGLVKSFDADSELSPDEAESYYKHLSRVREVNRVNAALDVGKLIEGKIDLDSIRGGRFMSESLVDMVLNHEYVRSFDAKSGNDRPEITAGSLHNSGLFDAVSEAFANGKGSTVAERVLAETGLSLESVVVYGMTNHWNVQASIMTRRVMDRVSVLFPHHGEEGFAPLDRPDPQLQKDFESSQRILPDKVVDTVLKAMYANTQSALRKAGVKEVTVARGVSFRDPAIFRKPDGSDFESVQIDVRLRPLSSTAGNASDALPFGSGGMVFVTKVPARSVFSTALTGFGTTGESEVVVLGGTYRSTAFQKTEITAGIIPKLDGMLDV